MSVFIKQIGKTSRPTLKIEGGAPSEFVWFLYIYSI